MPNAVGSAYDAQCRKFEAAIIAEVLREVGKFRPGFRASDLKVSVTRTAGSLLPKWNACVNYGLETDFPDECYATGLGFDNRGVVSSFAKGVAWCVAEFYRWLDTEPEERRNPNPANMPNRDFEKQLAGVGAAIYRKLGETFPRMRYADIEFTTDATFIMGRPVRSRCTFLLGVYVFGQARFAVEDRKLFDQESVDEGVRLLVSMATEHLKKHGR